MARGQGRKTTPPEQKLPRKIIKIDDKYRVIFTELCLSLQKKVEKPEDAEDAMVDGGADEAEDLASGWKIEGYYSTWPAVLRAVLRGYVSEKLTAVMKKEKEIEIARLISMYRESSKEIEKLLKGT